MTFEGCASALRVTPCCTIVLLAPCPLLAVSSCVWRSEVCIAMLMRPLNAPLEAEADRLCNAERAVRAGLAIQRALALNRKNEDTGKPAIVLLHDRVAEQRHQPVPELLGDLAAHFHDGGPRRRRYR
jgi:hypothetical protein